MEMSAGEGRGQANYDSCFSFVALRIRHEGDDRFKRTVAISFLKGNIANAQGCGCIAHGDGREIGRNRGIAAGMGPIGQ